MKHKELIDAIADKINRSQEDTENLLQAAVDVLTSQLLEDKVINLQGFGSFELKRREERLSVHPATQVRTLIPPKQTVNFRQSGVLKVKLKGIPSHE
ncbi:MAG TPA: HU family DNA-binding protein [Paludibacter sp.]|jgi:DNA-binding protein HU-beta|nr:MAG: DNA-binding protein HRm [Bacteroidetes bacterium ADurb.Bin174]HQB28672.1 HU family DNA-binding protein [Paludibacter sp.]